MLIHNTKIAQTVSRTLCLTADRYDQIFAIKQALIAEDLELFATDRETIDDILDILFSEFNFPA